MPSHKCVASTDCQNNKRSTGAPPLSQPLMVNTTHSQPLFHGVCSNHSTSNPTHSFPIDEACIRKATMETWVRLWCAKHWCERQHTLTTRWKVVSQGCGVINPSPSHLVNTKQHHTHWCKAIECHFDDQHHGHPACFMV